MSTIFGLPAHILLIHAVVVILPLAALLAIALAARPSWAFYLRWPLLALSAIGAGSAILAASAGEALQERLGNSPLVEQHAENGDLLEVAAIIFLVVAVAAFLAISVKSPLASGKGSFTSRLPANLAVVVRIALIGVAAWVLVQTIITGHSGAEAAWSDLAS